MAKDGAALPPSQAIEQPARLRVAVGETYDFEFVPQLARDATGNSIRYRLSFFARLNSVEASQWFSVRPASPAN